VAARNPVVENSANVPVEDVKGRIELESLAVGRLRATNMIKGFAGAIIRLLTAKGCCRRSIVTSFADG
jgi:hypothetical protein